MKTEVTELLGIEYPIIQGGMAWVAEYHLAAGVSNAGGLGLIGAASAPAEWVREQIREAKKLTDKPFGVNIMLISPYAEDVAKVVAEEGVKVVTTGAGSPEKYLKMWKEAQERQNGLSGNCFCTQLKEFWHILQHHWQLHLCLELRFAEFRLYLC